MPAHTNDLLPTFCAAAGVPLPEKPKVDGISLLGVLQGGHPPADRGPLFWKYKSNPRPYNHNMQEELNPTEVVRWGPWKLLARDGRPLELFNLKEDPYERWNLVRDEPKQVERLRAVLDRWLAEPRPYRMPKTNW